MKKILTSASVITIACIMIFYFYDWYTAKYWRQQKVLANDVICYYNYLPAIFVYQDVSLKEAPLRVGWVENEDGIRVEKMSMGLSYFYTPFFFTALAFTKVTDRPIYVYSSAFEFAIGFSGLLAVFLGLIMTRLVLRMFFNEWAIAFTLIVLTLGTNLYFYSVYEGAMSHAYNFFLFSCLMYGTIRWHDKPTWKNTLTIGFVAAMIVLVRPSNMVALIFPILYDVFRKNGLRDKWILVKKNWLKLALAAVIAFVTVFPQLLYWKTVTNEWIYYSYVNEGFFWANPQILSGLFSYRNGWLIYSPLMLLSLVGFVFIWNNQRKFFFPLIIFFLVNLYVIYSWWCWWYVGYGSRPMIDNFGFLSLPLAAFFVWMLQRKLWISILSSVIIVAFLALSIFQNRQYAHGIIHFDGMTKKCYWGIFLKKTWPQGYDTMVSRPDYDKAKKGDY